MATVVKIEKKNAEETRRKLAALNALDRNYAVESDEKFVYFPVSKKIAGVKIVERKARKKTIKPTSLKQALEKILTKKEFEKLIASFDIIGDVAVLEIPEELKKKEKQIAKTVMLVHRNVRAALKKASAMRGVYRTRKLAWLAGEKRTKTTYKESGCTMKLDLAKVYFSPRLAFERQRIANLVGENERVLVFFAGVAPFALVIAKKRPRTKIACIELNPVACRYARENIELNKMRNVEVVEGDVREIVPKKFIASADRILMPLPKGAEQFLKEAFTAAKKGCIVHFYNFAEEENPFEKALKAIRREAEKQNKRVEILNKRVVRPYAPRVSQIVVDFKIIG